MNKQTIRIAEFKQHLSDTYTYIDKLDALKERQRLSFNITNKEAIQVWNELYNDN